VIVPTTVFSTDVLKTVVGEVNRFSKVCKKYLMPRLIAYPVFQSFFVYLGLAGLSELNQA
jgi:hypothetical protein